MLINKHHKSWLGRAWLTLLYLYLITPTSLHITAQTSDDAVRTLIDKFFDLYQNEDVEALSKLWDQRSSDLALFLKETQLTFAAVEEVEVKSVAVRKTVADGSKATARVSVEMVATDSKTGKGAEGFGEMNRTFHLISENGKWKIQRYLVSEEELALALVAAQTEQERDALLEEDKDLQTVRLRRALIRNCENLIDGGKLPPAKVILRFAQKVAEQIGDEAGAARAVSDIGLVHDYEGDYPQALEYYQDALTRFERLGDMPWVVRSLRRVGVAYRLQGNYLKALEYYEKSLRVSEETGDKAGIGGALHNIGGINASQGNYEQALDYFQKALKLREELRDEDNAAGTRYNIGLVYIGQGNYEQALEELQKAHSIFERLNKGGSTLNAIGLVYERLGDYEQALKYYVSCLREHKTKASSSVVLFNIGNVYGLQGNHALALKYYEESLKISRKSDNEWGIAFGLSGLGDFYRTQGDYSRAIEYYQDSLRISERRGDKPEISRALSNIADALERQGNYGPASEFAERAAALADQIGNLEALWSAYTVAGKAYRALGQRGKAHQNFNQAIDIIEKLRLLTVGDEQTQQRFFEKKVAPYHAMVSELVVRNQGGDAFAYAERAKARVLLDVLRGDRTDVIKTLPAGEQYQERRLRDELVSANTQITIESRSARPNGTRLDRLRADLRKARLNFDDFQTKLYAAHPGLKVRRGEAHPVTAEEATALLPDSRGALIEYVVTDENTFLFVLTKGDSPASRPDLKTYTLNIKGAQMAALAAGYRGRLAAHDAGYREPARELYELLVKPALGQLKGKTSVVIVPDGVLWELPFQALISESNRHLIEEYAISYAPSLTALREMTKTRGKRPRVGAHGAGTTLLAFGNPTLGEETVKRAKLALRDGRLGPLPEAEKEVKALRRLYGASLSKVYTGALAREEIIKAEASDYRILHLATHGMLNDLNPMYSHVVLSQTGARGREDGLLEAWELMNLNLNADLVVLSACETARGRVGAGEGLIGLSWAIFMAGSSTTVASQWKVESSSTVDLMVEFHRQLRTADRRAGPPMSKAEAMKQAALKLMNHEGSRHPFYWAGFVVIGDGT